MKTVTVAKTENVLGVRMKKSKKYKVNKKLYTVLFFVSVVIICLAMFFSTESKWFVMVSGVGCGSFASVVVALLVEYFHCVTMNKKDKQVLNFALEDLFSSIADYCDRYSYFVVSIDKKYASEFNTFFDWVQIYSQLVAEGKPQVRKTYITGAMDLVKESFDFFYSNRVWYLENDFFSEEELHSIKEMCESIFLSKLHYMVSDMEVPHQIILDINQEIAKNMLKVQHFAKFADTKYSHECTLSKMFIYDTYE